MKKLLFFIVGFSLAASLSAQTPEQTVAKVVQALQGPESIAKWTNLEADGDFVFSAGDREINGKLRLVRKGQALWSRISLKFGSETYVMIEGFDGKAAWGDQGGTVSDRPSLNNETEARHSVDMLLKKDATWTLGKESEIDGKRAISLEGQWQSTKTVFWIDPESYRVLEITYKDVFFSEKQIKEEQEKRVRYFDYQLIDKVLLPMKSVEYTDGRKGAEVRYAKVTFNPQVAMSLFQRPQQKLDLRYDEEMID